MEVNLNQIVRSPKQVLDTARKYYPDYMIVQPRLRHMHLNRDSIIGLIGDRGGGKSLGGADLVLYDYMLQGEPCYSNMDIKAQIEMDDIPGVLVQCESQSINLEKFLEFGEEYQDGVNFIDEINISLADARRSMANQNLAADDVGQQLRKTRSALIYTCIHEMFVDSRIRDMTDFFIQTKDLALTPDGIGMRKRQGESFEWSLYEMTGKLTGTRYSDTGNILNLIFNGSTMWGLINTWQRQDRQKIKLFTNKKGDVVEIGESPAVTEGINKWGWLYNMIKDLHDQGYEEIHSEGLWDYLQPESRGFTRMQIGTQLNAMGIKKRRAPVSEGGAYYLIDRFDLKKGTGLERKQAVVS